MKTPSEYMENLAALISKQCHLVLDIKERNITIENGGPLSFDIDGFPVYYFQNNIKDELHLIFQLGTEHTQVDVDSYIAKNTINFVFSPNGEMKVCNSLEHGMLVGNREQLQETIKTTVGLFSEIFVVEEKNAI